MLALLALLPFAHAATYPLLESWAGNNFFNGFRADRSFYDNTTNGDTFWAGPSNSTLNYVNSAGRAVMKVDNTSFVPYNEKRYSPKILSKSQYNLGSVIVFDAVHMPYGCSVWPAFWTQGPNWPNGGEIDIVEGVNQQTTNQIAMHTFGNCAASSSSSITGTLSYPNCTVGQNSDSGCTTSISNTNSYGAGFAAAGGGVYVTEMASTGINVWFFTRSSVPSSLTSSASSLDTSTLGTPTATLGTSSCDIAQNFGPQTLTINIALCGSWASVPSILAQTCPALQGSNTCYTTYVINDAAATYANAYFEINYVNVYSSNSTASSSSSSGASSSAAGGQSGTRTNTIGVTGTPTSSPTSTGRSAAGRQWAAPGLSGFAALVLAACASALY